MLEGKHKQLCGREAVLLWGSAEEVNGQIELTAPRDAPDGIGSALVLVKWKPGRGARVIAETLERYSGDEKWRAPWLYITADPKFFYPGFYMRPYNGKIERGWSLGPTPEDQLIFDTTEAALIGRDSPWAVELRCDHEAFHIGLFTIFAGMSKHDWWSSVTRAGINCATGTEMAWPPIWLGFYCEASRTRWLVEDLNEEAIK